jgi:hypothetical protein
VRTASSISARVGRVIRSVGLAPDRSLEIRLWIFTSAFILFLRNRTCKAAVQWMAMERKGSRISLAATKAREPFDGCGIYRLYCGDAVNRDGGSSVA